MKSKSLKKFMLAALFIQIIGVLALHRGYGGLRYDPDSKVWTADVIKFRHHWERTDLTQAILSAKTRLESKQADGITLRLHFPSGEWCYDARIEPINLQADADLPFGLRDKNRYLPWEWPAQ